MAAALRIKIIFLYWIWVNKLKVLKIVIYLIQSLIIEFDNVIRKKEKNLVFKSNGRGSYNYPTIRFVAGFMFVTHIVFLSNIRLGLPIKVWADKTSIGNDQ